MSYTERHDDEEPPRGVRAAAILRWLIISTMAAAAIGSLAFYLGWFEPSTTGSSSAADTIYYCPMHPGHKQDHPGDCPICGMTLVPMPKEHGAAVPSNESPNTVPGLVPVDLTPDRIQNMGMRTARVTREPLESAIRTVGIITADEQGLAEIHTRFSGWIQTLAVSRTGEKVTRGQVVATIYSPELFAAQQELLNAVRWAQEPTIEGLEKDARTRLELLGIDKRDIGEIERTGKPLREIKLRSPVNGHVIRRNVIEGAYVQPGTALLAIADLSTVWVIADVYEYEASRVHQGMRATIAFPAYPSEKFSGKVTFLYPTVDPSTRTLRVRIELENDDLRLRPGMYGDVGLETDREEQGLVVPAEAVVDTGEVQYLFVAREGGRFEPRRVELGASGDDKVQITDGVTEGEIVVTTANFLIDSESRLRAAIQGEGAGGAAPAGAPSICDQRFDKTKYPDKHAQCRSCEAHRGMGSMEEDCRNAIAKPWK